ncbi:substance-P receptor-like protein, partial [Leptotrombidium deliense]
MRNPTNILLTNLAFADLGVSVFCIFQNLSLYLSEKWFLNDFMCKMYHFVQSLSYTTSILTLVMISLERYVVIVRPLHAKRTLNTKKLVYILFAIWLCSIFCCAPRLWMFGTAKLPNGPNDTVVACIMKQQIYNPKIYHIINFVALFLVPISIMSLIYSFICCRLYKNTKIFNSRSKCSECEATSTLNVSTNSVKSTQNEMVYSAEKENYRSSIKSTEKRCICSQFKRTGGVEGRNKVIRLLITIVIAFLVCNFPVHCRKLMQDWYPHYDGASNLAITITIVTNLLMYFNSALNPLLYALLSKKFRENMALILCFCRRM